MYNAYYHDKAGRAVERIIPLAHYRNLEKYLYKHADFKKIVAACPVFIIKDRFNNPSIIK